MNMVDSLGRSWPVAINVLTLGRVRQEAGHNLLEVIVPENSLADRLNEDPVELARVLFLVCRDEVDGKGVTAEDFYASLNRDALETGIHAILEGVVNFSPSGLRPAYKKMLEKLLKMEQIKARKIQSSIDSGELDKVLDSAIAKAESSPIGSQNATGGDAGNSPASPGSTSPPTEGTIASEP